VAPRLTFSLRCGEWSHLGLVEGVSAVPTESLPMSQLASLGRQPMFVERRVHAQG
jgi:hypothetical protein